jgi:hypothetical protein
MFPSTVLGCQLSLDNIQQLKQPSFDPSNSHASWTWSWRRYQRRQSVTMVHFTLRKTVGVALVCRPVDRVAPWILENAPSAAAGMIGLRTMFGVVGLNQPKVGRFLQSELDHEQSRRLRSLCRLQGLPEKSASAAFVGFVVAKLHCVWNSIAWKVSLGNACVLSSTKYGTALDRVSRSAGLHCGQP